MVLKEFGDMRDCHSQLRDCVIFTVRMKSFKYNFFTCNNLVYRLFVIKIQERLICFILICTLKLTVLVKRCTVSFWL